MVIVVFEVFVVEGLSAVVASEELTVEIVEGGVEVDVVVVLVVIVVGGFVVLGGLDLNVVGDIVNCDGVIGIMGRGGRGAIGVGQVVVIVEVEVCNA